MKVTVPLTKNVLLPLATMASASAIIGAIQIKMCGRGVIRAGKIIILVISCYDIIRIIKSLVIRKSSSGLLIDRFRETV